ncbi:glycosyltransferase [Candidatus Saccharibacteria bacterium]|nr:glycosyltransferase [Candidatus Saccharibacteria bacterium]
MTNQSILLISHYADNKGTTDYVLDHLCNAGMNVYYLRHPLPESGKVQSELLIYKNGKKADVKTYSSPSNFGVKSAKEVLLNLYILIQLKRKNINCRIGFGAINAQFSILAKLLKIKPIFWGVDYSEKRFSNQVLNKIYKKLEDSACKGNDYVIQPTKLQKDKRVSKHNLLERKAVIIPNGIVLEATLLNKKHRNRKHALVYVGSLSPQHGMANFIKEIYVAQSIIAPLYIFGNGEEADKIAKMVDRYNLYGKVHQMGSRPPRDIIEFVRTSQEYLIGIAPYASIEGGHVALGDSLKIKEYINMGMPYIASNVVTVDKIFSSAGKTYSSRSEMLKIIDELEIMNLTNEARLKLLQDYSWEALLSRNLEPLLAR